MVKLLCLRNTFLSSIDREARREREESARRLGAVLGEEPERNHWSGAEGGKSTSRSQEVSYANVRCTLLGVPGLNMCRYTHTLCGSGWVFCLWTCKAVQMGRGNSLKAE